MSYLLGATINVTSLIGAGVLLLLLIGYMFLSTRSRRKNQEETMKMLNELKQGDKVVTSYGVYGEIVSMKETDAGKIVTLKTGDLDSNKVGYISVNIAAIAYIDNKKDLILDANGEVIDPEEKKEEVLKTAAKKEEAETENKENLDTEKVEEPAKKTKKTTKKKAEKVDENK